MVELLMQVSCLQEWVINDSGDDMCVYTIRYLPMHR